MGKEVFIMALIGCVVGVALFNWVDWLTKCEVKKPILYLFLPALIFAAVGFIAFDMLGVYVMIGGSCFVVVTLIVFLIKNLFNK